MSIVDKIKEKVKPFKIKPFLAEHELIEQRINICNTCEHLSAIRNCKICGCLVDGKVRLKGSTCPIGKW